MPGKIEVVEYESSMKEKWNIFIEESNNGTIFHNLDFLSYHPEDRFDEHHLMFSIDRSELVGVMPMAIFKEENVTIAKSPYGGSYGGFVTKKFLPLRLVDQMVSTLLNYLKEMNIDIVYIGQPPIHLFKVPSCYTEYCLLHHGFKIVEREITSVIDLNAFNKDPFEMYRKECRTAIRKAQKEGVKIKSWSDDVETFYDILTETLNKHRVTPTHSLLELNKIRELVPNSLKIDLAYLDNTPIAGICSIICNPQVALIFYNAHRSIFKQYYAVNLLIHEQIKWAKEKRFRYVDFGGTIATMTDRPSVLTFKESFGSTGYFRKVFSKNL